MDLSDRRERLKEASKLLVDQTSTAEKLDSLSIILKGINPKLDKALENCAQAISKIEKIQNSELVELTAESLPENTEEKRKRKRTILLFIKNWKSLRDEIERVRIELEGIQDGGEQSHGDKVETFGRITAFAKGPFGIITLIAVVIAGVLIFVKSAQDNKNPVALLNSTPPPAGDFVSPSVTPNPSSSVTVQAKKKVKVIAFKGKKIALDELRVGTGGDCTDMSGEVAHYHAKNNVTVKTTDNTIINDPGLCAFGKVNEVVVEEIEL